LGASGEKAYQSGDFEAAEGRYRLAAGSMPLEGWKARFGEGTAALAGGGLARAERILERALADVPAAEECVVRVNLSLAQELQGDSAAEAADREGAVAFYTEALATLRDGGCPERDEVAAEAERRLEEKLEDQSHEEPSPSPSSSPSPSPSGQGSPSPQPSGGPSQSPSPSPSEAPASPSPSSGGSGSPSPSPSPSADPQQDKLDRLDERNRSGQRERNENREGRDYRPPRGDRPIW
jgi:hypothetical protein